VADLSKKPFGLADRRHLDAARGWLGLGKWVEANEELGRLTPELRGHPSVLRVRYEVYAAATKWEMAAEVARTISKRVPDDAFGFVHLAYALHELKRTSEARDLLLPIVERFPNEWPMRYNLACYAAQSGDLKAAWAWLEKAIDLAGRKAVKRMAHDDPDLEPLWREIAKIEELCR
jgi:predicted Zn-dependent protease